MLFGLLIVAESWGAIATGWVTSTFVETPFNFSFIGFEWLSVLHGEWMYYYYGVMGLVGVMVMIGWEYRWSMVIFLAMWSGVYLAQKTNYNNHYYFLMLLSMMMIVVPAHADKSLDAKRNTSLRATTCPQWCLWIFAAQVSLVYFYGGIAKMYPDWIESKPISIWFGYKSDYFILGPILAQAWFQKFISYGGLFFDTLIAPALIWKKTRKWAFIATIFFHLFNSAVFQVGIFPYLGIGISIFYFSPPLINRIFLKKRKLLPPNHFPANIWVVAGLCAWFLIQVLLPLRHWLFEGNVHWTEEGHRLAWHMMLRAKSGYVDFEIVDKDKGENWTVNPHDHVTDDQAGSLACRPDMCWQFVQYLKAYYAKKGRKNLEIYAVGEADLNGRGYAPLYNPKINLAKVAWKPFEHSEWLTKYQPEKE